MSKLLRWLAIIVVAPVTLGAFWGLSTVPLAWKGPGGSLIDHEPEMRVATFFTLEGEEWRPIDYPGLLDFCVTNHSECAQTEPDMASDSELAVAIATHLEVNSQVLWRRDGTTDKWSFPDAAGGDTEDWSLVKRRKLIEAGVPPGALRFVILNDNLKDPYVSLVVLTRRGPWLLDWDRPVGPVARVTSQSPVYVQWPIWNSSPGAS